MILRMALALLIVLAAPSACSNSEFSGSPSDKKPEATQKAPVHSSAYPSEPAEPSPLPNHPAPTTYPQDAVTKGSFTVWTVPSDPLPRQDYQIHIGISLPNNISNYDYSDLSGTVIGTDNYRRQIGPNALPNEHLKFDWWPRDQFNASGTTATVVLTIPGAESMVKDVIQVNSRLLNESQTIDLVF